MHGGSTHTHGGTCTHSWGAHAHTCVRTRPPATGLLGSANSGMRAAASGALYNLSSIRQVESQLLRNADLLPLLIGLVAKSDKSSWPCIGNPGGLRSRVEADLEQDLLSHMHAAGEPGGQAGRQGRNHIIIYSYEPGIKPGFILEDGLVWISIS